MERGLDGADDTRDGFLDALTMEARGILIAQLVSLVFAIAGARWDGGSAVVTRIGQYRRLEGGIAARVDDFAGDDAGDFGHTLLNPKY